MNQFVRNLGLIDEDQQKRIENASVLICGTGGMGGVCAEVLVRMGIGKIRLVDPDRFEESNLNRQIHSNRETIGQYKVEVLQKQLLAIHPQLKIQVWKEKVNAGNAPIFLSEVDYVVNGMDQLDASISLEREARRRKIPIVDAWLTPFASVFTMKSTDPHWEEFLNFPTFEKPEAEISPEDRRVSLRREVDYTLSHSEPFKYIQKELVNDVIDGKKPRPSLAPVVWLSGVLMANEVFKMIAGYPEVGPRGVFFDQYTHQLIPGKIKLKRSGGEG